MNRTPLVFLARVLVVAACGFMATGLSASAAARNDSSHAAGFFASLLEGRVWILERPNSRRAGDRGTVWAHYHAPDGTLRACAHLGGAYGPGTGRWRIVPSRDFRALYNYLEPGTEPDPGQRRGHTPLFYDPDTGRLHNEAVSQDGTWAVASRGWVQESWPRAMKDACPDLGLPAGLPINEQQTSAAFDTMIAQDPDAPLRRYSGSDLRGPGATGIALAEGRPALPAAALQEFLADNDGRVLVDLAGARHVLVLGLQGDELWLLDGAGNLADTGHLVAAAGGAEIALHYERLPIQPRYRIGEALPFLPTGERHAAMRLTDRLVAHAAPMVLPFPERGDTAFRIEADGTLTAEGGSGGMIAGRWRWSRGELIVTLDGATSPGRYPWRDLARHAGWTSR